MAIIILNPFHTGPSIHHSITNNRRDQIYPFVTVLQSPIRLESCLEYNSENWNFYLVKNGKNSNFTISPFDWNFL